MSWQRGVLTVLVRWRFLFERRLLLNLQQILLHFILIGYEVVPIFCYALPCAGWIVAPSLLLKYPRRGAWAVGPPAPCFFIEHLTS